MEKIKNSFIINSAKAREDCKKAIGFLDTNNNYEVVIYQGEKQKTKKQCAFFHSLLGEFVKLANDNGLSKNNIGWWKYQIKKMSEFYDTKKGCLFLPERTKQINLELNKLPYDIREDIIKTMTMNVKSISQATTKEIGVLIDNLLIQIVINIPQNIILTNEFISKAVVEKYNNLINSDIQQDNILQEQVKMVFVNRLKFVKKNNIFLLSF